MPPSADLDAHVAHFWHVRWALAEPFVVETLPHPSVHLVFEDGHSRRAEVAGVATARFTRQLVGQGWVFGIKLRPAAFRPLWPSPISELTDRVLPIADVLGPDGDAFANEVFAAPDLDARIAVAESFLRARLAPLPVQLAALRDLVERMATDRSLLRAEDAATAAGSSLRALQRQFRDAVGVSPKWVIQRYRLHEAAERLKGANPPSLAALAADLGYSDQAHFARDFKATVGRTPSDFATANRA